MDYLLACQSTEKIVDVQYEPEYQRAGTDIIWGLKNDISPSVFGVEVKTDSYYNSSKNIFWESMSNVERGIPGCFETSEADLFFYLFNPGNKLYIFPIKKTREWVRENKERFRTASAKNYSKKGAYIYQSQGYLIPRDIFVKECPKVIIVDIVQDSPQKIIDYICGFEEDSFTH